MVGTRVVRVVLAKLFEQSTSAMQVVGLSDSGEAGVMAHEIAFGNTKFKVEHVQKLALDASHITLPKDTRAECPVDVL